jgi:hypothetical protein
LVYRGIKDRQTQEDRVTVTDQTKVVAEGITTRVVKDVASHDGTLLEKTSDSYAQDKDGNVWYLGEDMAHYLPNGKVDTSGPARQEQDEHVMAGCHRVVILCSSSWTRMEPCEL